MKPNILFVIPALRTPEYTELAVRSLMHNTHGVDFDVLVCMDLDNAEDAAFYKKHDIPYKVRQAWGHWMMVNWEVLDAQRKNKPYNFIGLIHNDMVFGYDWLRGFRRYCEEHPDYEHYNDKLFGFNETYGVKVSSSPVCFIDQFDVLKFMDYTAALTLLAEESPHPYFNSDQTQFLPWIWSLKAHTTTFDWLRGGDYGIVMAARENRRFFTPIYFPYAGTFHFGNIACTLHPDDFRRIQSSHHYWAELANDPEFVDICTYLLNNVPSYGDHAAFRELLSLSKL